MSLDVSSDINGVIKTVVTEPMSILMRFALDMAKTRMEHMLKNGNVQEAALSKVQCGQIDTSAFNDLQKNGVEMAFTNFPADYVQRMSELAAKYGSHFAVIEIKPGNIASVAFPAKEANAVTAALKQIAAEQEEKSAGSLKFKSDAILEEDLDLADTVLEAHDIPAFMFKTDGNKALAIVPKEHEQQFDLAIKEMKMLKDKLSDLSVTKFTQTQPLDKLDYRIEELSSTEALEINKSLRSIEYAPAVKFVQGEDNEKVMIMYPASEKDRIDEIKSGYLNDRVNADKVLTNVISNDISINKKSLMVNETPEQYFSKVPGMEAYIYYDKSSFSENNSMISGKIVFDAQYNLYDKSGKQISEIPGLELAKNYNGKSRFMNKDTQITYSDTNSLEHIELYSASENKLMNIGIDNSENIRKVLAAQGYNQRTADIILRDINKKMSDEQKEIFAFNGEGVEIAYSDIPNIDELKIQFNIAQQITVSKAENVTGPASAVGEKIFVFDKSANKCALLPPGSKIDVAAAMNRKFEYDYVKSEAASNKILKDIGYDISNNNSRIQGLDTRHFDTNNLLLHNITYARDNDTVFMTAERSGKIDFISFDKNSSRDDVERNIVEKLGLKDDIAVAEVMHQFDKMGVIEKCTQFQTHQKDVTVEMTTKNCCSIIKDENAIYMPKEKIDAEKIASVLGLNKESGQKLADSISVAIRNDSHSVSGEKGQKLNEIVKSAADKFKSIADKSSDSVSLTVEKGR